MGGWPPGRVAHSIRKNFLGGLPFRFSKGWATLFFDCRVPRVRFATRVLGSLQLSTLFPDIQPLTFDFQLPIPGSYSYTEKSFQYYRILLSSCY